MTQLDAMRALMQCPAEDNHRRTTRVIYGTADAAKVGIVIKTRRKRATATTSRIGWVRGVHERRGA